MTIQMLQLPNLNNINKATALIDLNKQQIYELQLALIYLGYKLPTKNGVLDQLTKATFELFKKNTFQTNPTLIGPGSISILNKLIKSEYDEIEQETSHPKQESLIEPYSNPTSIHDINWTDFSAPVSQYFTVGEVTRYDKRRIPPTDTIKLNILKLALELDKIRIAYGKPIGVTSWYRPPHVNRSVGGARFSQHLYGEAADIYPIGGDGLKFERWLDTVWYGALGWGQKNNKGFTHLDCRNNKGFNSGGSKGTRWNY